VVKIGLRFDATFNSFVDSSELPPFGGNVAVRLTFNSFVDSSGSSQANWLNRLFPGFQFFCRFF